MNFFRISFLSLAAVALLALPAGAAETLRISSTIGPVDAGMLPLLTDTFSKKTGIPIKISKAGPARPSKRRKPANTTWSWCMPASLRTPSWPQASAWIAAM